MFVENLGVDSALYRARHPRTWRWGLDIEFLSAILHVLQQANWQRGGGKGNKPKPVRRPTDTKTLDAKIPMAERKRVMDDELARRRAARDRRGKGRRPKRIREVKVG